MNGDDPLRGLKGRFYRFVHVDKDGQWFNVVRHDEATEEELEEINLPDHLRPNTEMYDFVFYPRGHTLYFNHRSNNRVNGRFPLLTAGSVVKLLKALASLHAIQGRFGDVEVTALPSKEQLERILKMPSLRHLVIEVTKPNPDELGKAEEEVFRRMSKLNARKQRQEYFAERHESLKVDEDAKTLALVGAANGKVTGYGVGKEGRPTQVSTTEKPWVDIVEYDPSVTIEMEALAEATRQLPGHGK
jgi:hypothetical protein